ncbi:MAG: hypothetical protein RSC82_02130 [Oscillospiraceae bacterium]
MTAATAAIENDQDDDDPQAAATAAETTVTIPTTHYFSPRFSLSAPFYVAAPRGVQRKSLL